MPTYTLEHLKLRLTTPYQRGPTPNWDDWLQSIVDGFWSHAEAELEIMKRDLYVDTAIGPALERHGAGFKVYRLDGEPDGAFRFRIFAEMRARLGEATPDAILDFLTASFGVPRSTFTMLENEDPVTGEYKAAYYTVNLDVSIISALGYTPDQAVVAIAVINGILDRASAAGVRGEVYVVGGAEWGVDVWDAATTFWGSG